MTDSHAFLANLALVLGVAAITTYLFQRIRQPVVFGYLVAGMIVGPHTGIPLVADRTMVSTLSELGVILLMFGLGLEFSLRQLARVGATAGLVALVDTTLMFGFGYAAGQALGWTTVESVFGGAILAISSTTIIVKAFAEQQVSGRFTELVFGVLIFEDLIAIFLVAILTTVAAGNGLSLQAVGGTAATLALFLVAYIGVGLWVVPRLVRRVERLDRRETTLVVSLGLCFGGALLAVEAGYSVALGAFIAGSLVAESGAGKRIEHLVEGVRDMFGAIFFVSVGMLIDPRLVMEHLGAVLLLSAVVIVGKFVAVTAGAFLTGNDVRTATQTGMSLTQIGEFAFIIAAVGLASGAVRDFLYPVAVAVSAVTTLTTPLMIRASGPLASLLDRSLPRPLQTFVGLYGSWIERMRSAPSDAGVVPLIRRKVRWLVLDALVLAGVLIGASVARAPLASWMASRTSLAPGVDIAVLTAAAVALVLPLGIGIVRVSGALSSLLALRALPRDSAGRLDYAAAPRRVLMATLHLALVTLTGLLVVVVTGPFVPLGGGALVLALVMAWLGVVFWRSTADLYGHTQAGAHVMLAALARGLSAPASTPAGSDGAPMARPPRDLAAVHRVLPGLGDPVPVRIAEDSGAQGRTLRDLQLRTLTGAVVLAITRGDEEVLLPVGSERLQVGDVVAVAGTREATDAARRLLETPRPVA